jgi:hypothetical protein
LTISAALSAWDLFGFVPANAATSCSHFKFHVLLILLDQVCST